jgi:large subunit ribosomal protein L35
LTGAVLAARPIFVGLAGGLGSRQKLRFEEEATMPKMKTHKGTAKRFRLTKNGKVMRMLAGRSHLRRRKKASKNSDFRHAVPSDVKYIVQQVKQIGGSAVK